MKTPLPTKVGDVLIVQTTESFSAFAVGAVTTDGQNDFSHPQKVVHYHSLRSALRAAKDLRFRIPHSRIYLLNIDTKEWADITDAPPSEG